MASAFKLRNERKTNFNEQLEMAQAYLSDRRKLLDDSLKTRSASCKPGR